jgi:oligosaccharide repeat unit polymerase
VPAHQSRSFHGVTFLVIGIFAALLIFHIQSESRISGFSILAWGALLGVREIVNCIRDPSKSAIANGNVWVLASLLLIFVVSPTVRILSGAQLPLVFARRDTETNLNQVNSLASIAIFSVILGSRIFTQTRSEKAVDKNFQSNRSFKPSLGVSILIVTFWITLYFYWATSQGNPFTAIFGTRSSQRAFGVVKTNGYLVDSLYGALGVLTAWLAYSIRENNGSLTKKILPCCLIFVIPSFLQGDRSKTIFFIIVISIILTGWNRKVKRSYILLAAVLIPILVVAPRVYRQSQDQVSSIANAAFSMTNIVETFTKEDTAMAPTLSILLDNLGSNVPYQYGKSYINLVAKPIPRTLWPGKPIEFDTQLMRVLFPTYAASGVGFAFSAISEPLVNFGLIGVVFFFTGIGFLNRKLLGKLINSKETRAIFLNAWLAGFMFVLIRGNLSVDFQRAVFPLVSGLSVLYFHDARAGKTQKD